MIPIDLVTLALEREPARTQMVGSVPIISGQTRRTGPTGPTRAARIRTPSNGGEICAAP